MIDARHNTAIPLETAGHLVPGGASRSTLFRWKDEGFRGVKLVTIKAGKKRLVYPSAIADFVRATTEAADMPPPPELQLELPFRSDKQRRAAARQAKNKLAKLGLLGQRKKKPPAEVTRGGDGSLMQGAQENQRAPI
jgi:hypothetical protein